MKKHNRLPLYKIHMIDRAPILRKNDYGTVIKLDDLLVFLNSFETEGTKTILDYIKREIQRKEETDNFSLGELVITKKGCRIKGCMDTLEVVGLDRKWGQYPAVMCKKQDGSIRLFLSKNLVRSKDHGK